MTDPSGDGRLRRGTHAEAAPALGSMAARLAPSLASTGGDRRAPAVARRPRRAAAKPSFRAGSAECRALASWSPASWSTRGDSAASCPRFSPAFRRTGRDCGQGNDRMTRRALAVLAVGFAPAALQQGDNSWQQQQ